MSTKLYHLISCGAAYVSARLSVDLHVEKISLLNLKEQETQNLVSVEPDTDLN